MIPKIIHYCWFGGNPLPVAVKKCIDSWEKYCPDYEIKEWNESNYDVNKHPFMKAAYESKCWAFVSDYARLDIIYTCGGVYLDTDVELKTSLDKLSSDECYFGMQQLGNYIATGLGFGGEAGHLAIKMMLEKYDALEFDVGKKEELACPIINTEALVPFGYIKGGGLQKVCGATIYPAKYFDPLSPGNTENLLCEETISIHHYAATWTSKRNQMKRKLFNWIGDKNIHMLKRIMRRDK